MAASGEYVTLLFSGSYGYPKMELGLHPFNFVELRLRYVLDVEVSNNGHTEAQ